MPGAGREMRGSVVRLQRGAFGVTSSTRGYALLQLRKRRAGSVRIRPIDVFPQVFPDIVGHVEEHLDDLGIELPAGPEFDFRARGFKGLRVTVGTVRGHGVEGVGDWEHTCAERNLIALQSSGIAKCV